MFTVCKEFKRYTAEGHPDHDTLNVCITRVHEYLDQHQEKGDIALIIHFWLQMNSFISRDNILKWTSINTFSVLMKKSGSLTSSGKKMSRKSSSPALPVSK